MALVDTLLAQAEAYDKITAAVYRNRDGLRSLRDEADQLSTVAPPTAPPPSGPPNFPGPGGLPAPSPFKPAPESTSTAGGGGGAPSAGTSSSGSGSAGFTATPSGSNIVTAQKGGAFATLDWVRKHGIKGTEKIFNPNNHFAAIAVPPDLITVTTWDCSSYFPPTAIFIDPESLPGSNSSTQSATQSGGSSGGSSAAAPGGSFPSRHVVDLTQPGDPGGGGSGGGNSGDLGNGSGGAPIGGGKALTRAGIEQGAGRAAPPVTVVVQAPAVKERTNVTPGEKITHSHLERLTDAMNRVAAGLAAPPSRTTDYRRNRQ